MTDGQGGTTDTAAPSAETAAPSRSAAAHRLLTLAGADDALAGALLCDVEAVERTIEQELESNEQHTNTLCAQLERYRGKMLRPLLASLCAQAVAGGAVGEAVHKQIHTFGAVVELVHLATLVHDDVLDDAAVRRGGATINRMTNNETAVILGDYLIASAFRLCATLPSVRYAQRIGAITKKVCEGELLQLASRGNDALSDDVYFRIIEGKTAALIAVACELGAALAGATPNVAAACWAYGEAVGAAFQIQDDVLDLTGDAAVVGKPMGQDLAKGKATLPMLRLLANTDASYDSVRTALRAALRGDVQIDDVFECELREALAASGAIEAAQAEAVRRIEQAKAAIAGLPDGPGRSLLYGLAGAVVVRDL